MKKVKMDKRCWYFLSIMIISFWCKPVFATEEKWRRIIDLEGEWKFTIGDNMKWADPNYPDKDWENIDVPAKWEDEGFYGYNGFAWYRKAFDGTILKNKNSLYNLFLGYIDDVDEVYLNGHKIGFTGTFPPRFSTAYNAQRNYPIPNEYINYSGRNVISVRVYDSEIEGGIISGDIGIFTNENEHNFAVNLRGVWDFSFAERRASEELSKPIRRVPSDKAIWTKLTVPATWEQQGYGNYDGSGWYRKQFAIPSDLDGEDLVLLLGKIDDFDQTYFNGKLIGSTNQFDRLRIYTIPSELFKGGAINLLLVYVNDPQGLGGIYEGPVGIMKQSDFTKYLRWRE